MLKRNPPHCPDMAIGFNGILVMFMTYIEGINFQYERKHKSKNDSENNQNDFSSMVLINVFRLTKNM